MLYCLLLTVIILPKWSTCASVQGIKGYENCDVSDKEKNGKQHRKDDYCKNAHYWESSFCICMMNVWLVDCISNTLHTSLSLYPCSIYTPMGGCSVTQSCPTVTPWTVAHQAPLSMGFSRQKYWSGLPCSPPGFLPYPGIEPMSPIAPAVQVDSLPLSHQGSPSKHAYMDICTHICIFIYIHNPQHGHPYFKI